LLFYALLTLFGAAIPSRHGTLPHSRGPDRIQPVQLHHRGPGLALPDVHALCFGRYAQCPAPTWQVQDKLMVWRA
jgi:hypothetical protein